MASKVPQTFRKYVAQKLTSKFREAVELVTTTTPELGPGDLLVRNRFVGINASDINYTAGRYDPKLRPPFDVGFEGVGEVVAVGPKCSTSVGQAVGYMKNGSFSEFMVLPETWALPLPDIRAEYVPLLVSGLTAAISLDKVGELKAGETVLVTAAAGGTGQFAVQLAKNAGCHVIGTCSSQEKVDFLKKIGCDRAINYNKEDLRTVLRSEYRKGVNVVYECIGGETFDICLDSLATQGRLIIIGMISGYENQSAFQAKTSQEAPIPVKLLIKSASVRGFYLFSFFNDLFQYLPQLISLQSEGKLKVGIDNGRFSPTGNFIGIESIPAAVDYMYSRKNVGKVIVDMGPPKSNL